MKIAVSVLERTYAEKWTVEKKFYIQYMLQACEFMHVIAGPLQSIFLIGLELSIVVILLLVSRFLYV